MSTNIADSSQEAGNGLADEVRLLNRAVVRGMEGQLAPFGLISMEFAILKSFLDQDEWTVTHLAELLPADAPRISRLVTRLVEGGLLRRRRRTDDRRVVLLKLTARGQSVAEELRERVSAYENSLLAGVSAGDLEAMRRVAATIVANREAMGQAADDGEDADED